MLQKQTINIPLGLGVNTKTDEKLVEQGQFNLVCENATFQKIGSVSKRQGYGPLSKTYYEPESLTGFGTGDYTGLTYPPVCVAALGKSTFLKNKVGEYLYSHGDNFILKNDFPIPECKVSTKRIYSAKTSIDQTDTDYDPNENIIVAAARNSSSSGGFALVIYDLDEESSVTIESTDTTGNTRTGFTRVGGQSYYYHIYVSASGVLKIDFYDKYGQILASQFTSSFHSGPIAVCASPNRSNFYIISNTTTANLGRILKLSGTTVVENKTFAHAVTSWVSATSRYDSGTNRVYFAYIGTTLASNQVRQVIFEDDGDVFTADAALTNALGEGTNSITYRQDSSNLFINNRDDLFSAVQKLYGYVPGTTTRYTENFYTNLYSDMVDLGGIKCALASNVSVSSFPETFFGIGSSQDYAGTTVFARLGSSAGTVSGGQICRMAKISETMAVVAHPILSYVNEEVYEGIYNMALTFFEFNPDYKSHSRASLGANIHFQGGFITEFDGENLYENGFHLPCPVPILDTSAAGSLTGTYAYRAVIRHTDRNGQVTRSAPSDAVGTGPIASKQVRITMQAMPFGVRAVNCVVEFYRSSDSGVNYQYAGEIPATMYGSANAWASYFTDNTSDISTNAFIYTAGNVLENNPAPAGDLVCQGGNRLFVAGLDDKNEVAYSKKKLFGESVNFNDLLRIRFDSAQFNVSGGITAHGYMDGKYIPFKRNSIFYVAGDGPLETGADNNFTDPELISSDTGCTEPRSVVLGPTGLFFKGEKGIYLLDRGLSTKYIGAGVEEFNPFKVTSAVHLDKKNQVVFTVVSDDSSEKYMLAYDYFTEQWSVNKGLRCIDGDLLDGDHAVLSSADSTPYVQDSSTFLDESTVYSMRLKTPWIKVSGIQDFARIWRAYILGKFKSAHDLKVIARYDYDESYTEEFTISPSVLDTQYQYSVHLRKQKCEAVQFEIYDENQTGESMELTALTLEVGLRKGGMKLSPGRKY